MHLRSFRLTRLHLLPLLFAIGLVNPFTYFVLHTSRTYFWVVPLTLAIWLGFRWSDLERNPDLAGRPGRLGIAFALLLIAAAVARNLVQEPGSRVFGLFDMFLLFVALCSALFGIRSLRAFWVPASFLVLIGLGYSAERYIVDHLGYADLLAGMVTGMAKALGAHVSSSGALISLPISQPARLLVDYGCTGIKGIIAFAFISCIPILESGRDTPGKVFWVALALVGFYLASVFRLVAVVFAVLAWGKVAVDYHTAIGFAFFMAWLAVVTYFGSTPRNSPRVDGQGAVAGGASDLRTAPGDEPHSSQGRQPP